MVPNLKELFSSFVLLCQVKMHINFASSNHRSHHDVEIKTAYSATKSNGHEEIHRNNS